MNQDLSQGIELHRAGRSADAVACLERAAQDDDPITRATALNHLGAAQFAEGFFEDAVTTFREAIAQTPGKPRLHCNLGNALIAVGRPGDAKREYEAALKLDPDYPEAKQGLVVAAADLVVEADHAAAAAAAAAEPPIPDIPLASPPPTRLQTTPRTGVIAFGPPTVRRNGLQPGEQAPRPAAVAPPAATASGHVPDASESLRHVEELGARVRNARATLEQSQRLVAEQQDTLNRLTQEMLAALAEYQAEQEEAIRNAALKQAQALLTNAAAAATTTSTPAARADNAVSLWQELPSSAAGRE